MNNVAFILFLLVIQFNFACSSTSQSSTNQNLEVKSVEPFAPTNEILDVNSISPELIEKSEKSRRFIGDNMTITKIDGEITDEMIIQGRDLSLYEKADTDKCNSYNCKERKQREFIWQHWKNKKRGYIKSFQQGIDVSFLENIFIEPNEQGKWIIVWKIATNHAMLGNDISENTGIIEVKRIIAQNGGYKIELQDKEGKILRIF